ncbi:Na-Ca exchanger/integrin-beta4 domain protein, partial [Candidatus Thiomargarita nelsonii]
DPRLIRAEDFDPSTGSISSSELIYQEDVELRVTMPDDPKIAKLRVYYPQWDGTNFSLELMGEIELTQEQEISPSSIEISSVVPVTTILNNGDSANRIDLSILGDGYTASELSQYASDVQNAIDGLFDSEPFKEYQNYFNVHRLDVTSNESGADHPSDTPPKYKDTALDATYNCAGIERMICVNHGKVNNILFDSVQPNQRDMVLILVNDTKYGGSGGSFAVASIHNSVIELVLHELGHSFGLLADEYDYGNCYNAFEPWQPNVTKEINRHLIKWNVGGGPPTGWIDLATPIPTFGSIPGVPGLYEGAKYCRTGLYRPTYNSKMRSLWRPFEQINEEQLIKRIYHFVSPLDSSRPVNTHITLQKGQNQNFEANVLNPLNHSLNIEWMVDGEYISSGSDFTLNSTALSLGNHAVEVIISDQTTKVRYDPNNVLKEIRSWEVKVDPLNTVQFTLASYSVAENGGQVSIIATRVGDSNGAISVNYATSDNTATAGSDYTATSGTLNWADGDATDKSFTITISDDGKSEGPETFTITLYDPVSGESLDNAIVTISDNDTTIVNLVKFTATALETGVVLEWQTVSEIDTEGFYILR